MSRYVNMFQTGMSAQQASDTAAQYLQAEGFKYMEERGENVWRKGFGALANPQFIKCEIAPTGMVRIEAWTAGVSLVPGVYGGELNPMEGVFGWGPKMALKPRVRELERRLGGGAAGATAPVPTAPAQTPAGWFPDPTGKHEQRYWDGAVWTANVSDAGQSSTDAIQA